METSREEESLIVKEECIAVEKKNVMIHRKRERSEDNIDEDIENRRHRTDSILYTDNISLNVDDELKEIQSSKDAKSHWDKINKENLRDLLISAKEFIFGNYDKYYYKRYLEALKDPRLSVFKTEWFKDKKCLDIGCNDGTLTIMIALCYQPKIIEGVDIDYRLVKKAIKNMKYVIRNNLSKKYLENLIDIHKEKNLVVDDITNFNNINGSSQNSIIDKIKEKITSNTKSNEIIAKLNTMPKSFLLSLGYPMNNSILEKDEKLSIIKNENNEVFPKNIFFSQENFVAEIKEGEKYDTILCLSVVKWIHLNYGDIGVKILFFNIYKLLRIGGYFIFEPQCWKSYKKRKNLTPNIKAKFSEIKLRPERFKDYLEGTYGFECVMVTSPPSNAKKSFERPIYIFKKIK